MIRSRLGETLDRLAARAASAVVARGRLDAPALNAALLRRLAVRPGVADSLLADPVFEIARVWKSAGTTFGALSGGLLHPDLVEALDRADPERMPSDRQPYAHQLAAWQAARDGMSCLVSSGTGSGKTECFMVPMLDDLLRDPANGPLVGVRAIVIYPLNALIESQRERLAAWTERLSHRLSFALYNGDTPETPRQVSRVLAGAERGDRRTIRAAPPSILITNITMLEYLLLRAQDQPILDRSQGRLRWIMLDEAHSYLGAQAAEMALLLRRVRAAFGVVPEQVRLMATSATISEGDGTEAKLKRFLAALAGQEEARVRVIEGLVQAPALPPQGIDHPIDAAMLDGRDPPALWDHLAQHPRIQALRAAMTEGGVSLAEAGQRLLGVEATGREAQTEAILDAAAQARQPGQGASLLPWRAHLFHRAQGGLWVCVDPACPEKDPELRAPDAGWGFGAVWLRQRDRCACRAPVFELVACTACGRPHLRAGMEAGAHARLVPCTAAEPDEFAVDAEPDPDADGESPVARSTVLLRPASGTALDRLLDLETGAIFDNTAPADARARQITIIEDEAARNCCADATERPLQPQRYGPPFLIGTGLPLLLESLAPTLDKPGLPMGGRRALTFSDSRQGTARLAAKLQQEAERTLTRAFLYHVAEEGRGAEGADRAKLERRLNLYRANPDEFAEDIQQIEQALAGAARPVPWNELVDRLSHQTDLCTFATEVWRERSRGGREMAEDARLLARMFLFRELFRRPMVQNNAETMGLVRLAFPALEARAKSSVPAIVREAGVDGDGWVGLALAAIDFGFRDNIAVDITPDWLVRWVSPRGGWIQAMARPGLAPADRPERSRPWPSPRPSAGRPSRLTRLIFELIGGNADSRIDQDRAREVLAALWDLISTTAARDIGRGAYRLDFGHAAIVRVEQAWLCPVTRRLFGYSPAGRSPYDPLRSLVPIGRPRLPLANAGGLDPAQQMQLRSWCASDPQVAELRLQGHWNDLHDRIAAYAPFVRVQEHSAQIPRPVLEIYERWFKEGRVNLLNCSTTMEMGVDIPNVSLVVNANVPPSVSNYRQRVGRAARRGEPWGFAMTFCRDLPLDWLVFDAPAQLLSAPVTAPSVRLDSPSLVARHVNALLLAAFLRGQSKRPDIRASTGAFFGATDDADAPVAPEPLADAFLTALRGDWARSNALADDLALLVAGTALDGRSADQLAADTAEAFQRLLSQWRAEYNELLARGRAAAEADVQAALANRAKRMRGEFLLGELARRGFNPAYGFPVDVVTFDHLGGDCRARDAGGEPTIAFGDRRGGASRTLDVAIREYGPGAEVVVDGLVHLSEGVLPAWSAMADASGLEDLQIVWECDSCSAFDIARLVPENCPACDAPVRRWHRTLRPTGFLGRKPPHTGYENLGHVPYEMPRLRAAGAPWQALPDPQAGRLRADPAGQIITTSAGAGGKGYCLCLHCGRAEAETEETPGFVPPLPASMRGHAPLAAGRGISLVNGRCPGGLTAPLQRNVRLVHAAQSDVFELQLPAGANAPAALALAAALREALAARLGAEVRELGVAIGASTGPAGERRLSVLLHDRAAGGAGLVSRLAESDWFRSCLLAARDRLNCNEECAHGCPACVLRPDLNFNEERLDRPAGYALAKALCDRLELPASLRVFGHQTRLLGLPLADWLDRRRTAGLSAVTLFLHGEPKQWELDTWPLAGLLARLRQSGVAMKLVVRTSALTDRGLDLAQRLDLHRLAAHATLAMSPDLPMAGSAPLIAVAELAGSVFAIAAPDPAESVPGPEWALGASVALVRGAPPSLPAAQDFDSQRLIALAAGNAHLVHLGSKLDGSVAAFGRSFWTAIRTEAPLLAATIQAHGVHAASYTDRYLLSPLTLRLLFEVLHAMPCGKDLSRIHLLTARQDRSDQQGWSVFHPWADDAQRRQVIALLLPKAALKIQRKAEVPHARSLELKLGDERRVRLLLDQGFGAWRADGSVRHDFQADPATQARALRSASFRVSADATSDTLIVIEGI